MKYKGFTIVPDAVVKKYGFVGGLIYGKITRYCEWSDMGVCSASNKRLAEELSMGESTVRKYKDLLKNDGLIKVVGKKGSTDTVTITEEMVLLMEGALPDSEECAIKKRGSALPDSDKESIRKNKDTAARDPVTDMLKGKTDPLQGYPEDVKDLLYAFVKVLRAPTTSEKAFWIKTARQWKEMGVQPSQVRRMYQHCRDNDLAVKSPASITFAYDEIRNEAKQHEQYRKGD